MAPPLLLSENLWSTQCFPAHIITADEEAVGFEAWHVGDGRRSAFDTWTPITANAAHWNRVQCNRVRAMNCWFLDDRARYLAGYAVQYQTSYDNANWQVASAVTLPTASVTNNLNDAAYGVRTEEGAWGQLLAAPVSGLYHRLYVPAMGAGLLPSVVGLYAGMAYQPGFFNLPWGEDQDTLVVQEVVTPLGWKGRGPVANLLQNSITLNLPTDEEYDLARYHIQGHFGAGRPTWICYDQAQADRSFLAVRPQGPLGFEYTPQWFPRSCRFAYEEWEPLAS